MATTQNSYTGDGTTVLYSFTFPYLEESHVKVTLDEVVTTAYTFANATQIQFNTAPASSVRIRIYRETNVDTAEATFFAGSSIRHTDLNDNQLQALYAAQEQENNKWGKNVDTIVSTETWSSSDTKIATTASVQNQVATQVAGIINSDVVAGNAITVTPNTPTAGKVTVAVTNNSIDTAELVDASVTTAKIADNNVTSDKILNGNVTTAKIADANVTEAKLATDSVTSAKIAAGAVDTSELATDAVTSVKIADANVTTAKIANSAVNSDKLANDSVIATKILNNTITTDKLTDATVVTDAEQATVVTNDTSFFTTTAADSRFVNTTGDTMSGALNMGTNKITNLGTPTATTDATTKAYVDSVVASGTIADADYGDITVSGSGTTWTIDNNTITSAKIVNGTIVDGDINASAAIAGTKVSPDFGSQDVQTSGLIKTANGTAVNPSITFTSDTNTGVYRSGVDEVGITTGGVRRGLFDGNGLRVDGQNVTISDQYPAVILDGNADDGVSGVILRDNAGNGSGLSFIHTNYVGGTDLNVGGDGTVLSGQANIGINAGASSDIRFGVNDVEAVRIDSNGRVGVGTSPSALMHVSSSYATPSTGGISANTHLIVSNNNAASGEANISLLYRSNAKGRLNFGNQLVEDVAYIEGGVNYLAFGAGLGSVSADERLRITSAGLVGIGETSPTARLHLSGTNTAGGIKIVDSSSSFAAPGIEVIGKRSDGNVSSTFAGKLLLSKNRTDAAISSTNVLGSVAFGGNHTDGTEANILYSASIVGAADGAFNSATDMPTALVFNTGATGRAPDTAGVTTGTERLRITSTGLVGIGTSSPAETLDVNGNLVFGASFAGRIRTKNAGGGAASGTIEISAPNETTTRGVSFGNNYYITASNTYAQTATNIGGSAIEFRANNVNYGEILFRQKQDPDVGGGERTPLVINTSGNVGIGTTSPTDTLNISSSANQIGLDTGNQATYGTLDIGHFANGAFIGTQAGSNAASNLLRFGTSGTERARLDASGTFRVKGAGTAGINDAFVVNGSAPANSARIDSNGRVGIGTSGPSSLLHTSGARDYTGSTPSFSSYDVNFQSGTAFVSIGQSNGIPTIQGHGSGTAYNLALCPNAGKVGIGTTSPGFTLDVNGNPGFGTTGGVNKCFIKRASDGTANSYIGYLSTNSTDFAVKNGSGAGDVILEGNAGNIRFNTASSTERARIDSSGRLLVGASSTSGSALVQIQGYSGVATGAGLLDLKKGSTTPADGDALGALYFSDSGSNRGAQITGIRDGGTWTPGSSHPGRLAFSTTADGASSPTERMRITRNGDVCIGSLVPAGKLHLAFDPSASNGIRFSHSSSTYTNSACIFVNNSGTTVGSIKTNGTTTSYNTSSDYRLKENVALVSDGITRLQQLKPSRFNFIADLDTVVDGFLAHEVQTIVPEAITGTKDEVDADGNPVYQGIDQSKLVPLLTAALQEAIGRIETLEGMVAVNNITINEQQHQLSTLAARLTALESA